MVHALAEWNRYSVPRSGPAFAGWWNARQKIRAHKPMMALRNHCKRLQFFPRQKLKQTSLHGARSTYTFGPFHCLTAAAALYLAVEWRSVREPSLLFWSAGFATISIGTTLALLRSSGLLLIGIWFANGLLVTAHWLLCCLGIG